MTFYNFQGQPIAYTDDDIHIFLFTGEPVAYIYENAVYGYNGRQFGWFNCGWVRDLFGACAFFTENASESGPMKPMKRMRPMKSMKRMKPMKCMREMKRMKAINQLGWSKLSGTNFFLQ